MVVSAWKEHFELISKSKRNEQKVIDAADKRVLSTLSLANGNDIDILPEEIEIALNKLKLKKSADHSGITAEHLKYGGQYLRMWLLQIMNAIFYFEKIPDHLNLATVTPVYKG